MWAESLDQARLEITLGKPNLQKNFAIPKEAIRDIARGYGACFVTDKIMVEGRKVGYVYRETPDNEVDSGWRFMAGDESTEYMDNHLNMGVYDVNTLANYDPEVIAYLESPAGSAFARLEPDKPFIAL
ncbi:MAG: DUF2185 domain-containing protein [Cyanobacteria bacterium J06621_11]